MTTLRFYLDENVDPEVAEQLIQKGIEAISTRSLGKLGDSDVNHLQRATEMGFVLCTHDADFLRMNAQGVDHSGIVFSSHDESTIGGWVRELQTIHSEMTAEAMKMQVKFISTR
jgi:hypothetical protein